MSHGLLLWLENIDRRRNEVVPIPPKLDRETLRAHHKTLTVHPKCVLFPTTVIALILITVKSMDNSNSVVPKVGLSIKGVLLL